MPTPLGDLSVVFSSQRDPHPYSRVVATREWVRVRHVAYTNRILTIDAERSRMSRERGDAGRYTETVTLDDVIGVFGIVEGPVVTSGDVAETLDCSRETARRKLRSLEEQGS